MSSAQEAQERRTVTLSSPEIMRKIVEAEKESQKMLEETKREISELRKDVPNKVASMRQQILREATEQREKALAEADRISGQEAEQISLEAKRHVESLSKIAKYRRKQAVERAIELLLS
jgi:vacuolar-type H+-ATPase subunit H